MIEQEDFKAPGVHNYQKRREEDSREETVRLLPEKERKRVHQGQRRSDSSVVCNTERIS